MRRVMFFDNSSEQNPACLGRPARAERAGEGCLFGVGSNVTSGFTVIRRWNILSRGAFDPECLAAASTVTERRLAGWHGKDGRGTRTRRLPHDSEHLDPASRVSSRRPDMTDIRGGRGSRGT